MKMRRVKRKRENGRGRNEKKRGDKRRKGDNGDG
jgi:hypothetical protein